MYLAHWGLICPPFSARLGGESFYRGAIQEEALARLHFLVEQRRHLGLLLGEPGIGKSAVLEVFGGVMRATGQPVVTLNLSGLEKADFLGLLAAGLGLFSRCGLDCPEVWRKIGDRLAEFRYQQLQTTILLDDADQAGPEVLRQLARLVREGPAPQASVTIVLAGRLERIGRLGGDLLGMADLRIDLEPWDRAETEGFLNAALARAGRSSPIFEEPAILRLHELSGGVPRHVSLLADLALLAGAGRKLERIDAETVESACRELGVIQVEV